MIKYEVTESIQKSNNKNRYMDVGIHENVEMTEVKYAKSDKSEYLAFYFVNERQEQVCHTEWKIKMKQKPEEMEAGLLSFYAGLVEDQVSRVNSVATSFISKEEFKNVKGDSFEAFSNATIAALGENYKGKKVRIKVVFDRRNYTSLPNYTNYTWIESMDIPKEESAIEILNKDKMIKDLPKKMEGADSVANIIEEKSIASAVPVTTDEKSDMPF